MFDRWELYSQHIALFLENSAIMLFFKTPDILPDSHNFYTTIFVFVPAGLANRSWRAVKVLTKQENSTPIGNEPKILENLAV